MNYKIRFTLHILRCYIVEKGICSWYNLSMDKVKKALIVIAIYAVFGFVLLIFIFGYRADLGKKETKSYMFEEINEGDWVYIAVVADEDEEELSDNYTTMFSVQTERKIVKNSNPYEDLMQLAKTL